MKRDRKYLDELSVGARYFTVKVKVADKQRPQQGLGKNKYKRLTLEDEKGNSMQAMIYSDDIDNYSHSLIKNKEYEISNASISRARKTPYPEKGGEYKMTISSQTVVHALDSSPAASEIKDVYCRIAEIPPHIFTEAQYDVVVVALYVGIPKTITSNYGRPVSVCQLVVTDNSTEGTLVVTAWNDLAATVHGKLASIIQSTPVIGLTCLKPSAHKGFSLSSTMSTFMSLELELAGEMAAALIQWKSNASDTINARKLKVERARDPSAAKKISGIHEVLALKKEEVTQEEIFRLEICIPNFSREDITFFVACKRCGKKCDQCKNDVFVCEFCGRNSIATTRLFFNFEGTDSSATMKLVAYTETAESMLEIKADALLAMNAEDLKSFYAEVSSKFMTPICVDIAPAAIPAIVQQQLKTVKWVVKDVVEQPPPKASTSTITCSKSPN